MNIENKTVDKEINQDTANANNLKDTTKKEEPRGKISKLSWVAIFVLTVVVSSVFGAFFGMLSGGAVGLFSSKMERFLPARLKSQEVIQTRQQLLVEDSAVIEVVEKASPSVVSIVISKNVPRVQDMFNIPGGIFSPFFGDSIGGGQAEQPAPGNQQKEKIGGGTGFFISKDGLILTNKHVVEDEAAEYTVITNDGKEYAARVLARDPVRDIAVIKVDGADFLPLPLGKTNNIKIGQTVIAIGNSLGEFSNSVSRGIVSGLKRSINATSGLGDSERLTDIMQTDAAINSGNSGGPLLNLNGEVVGINVARAQGAENVGFALPIDQADRIILEAKSGKKVAVPFLGVRYVIINQSIQKEAQLPFAYGALIVRGAKLTDLAVLPGSSADKAGLVENDILLEVEGKKITEENQLTDLIANKNVGDVITVKVWHKGETKDVKITLQERK